MKSGDEIKKGLWCCTVLDDCKGCPYLGDGCHTKLKKELAEYIQQLEAERDAAVREFARKDCVQCKWHGTESKDRPCLKCYDNEYWHWRGVPKEVTP